MYGLQIDKDISIPVRDRSILVADLFRPDDPDVFPAIMTLGPYPKDIHFRDWNGAAYENVPERDRTCIGRPSIRSGGCLRATLSSV
jgi:hypothetical protein